MKIISGNLRGAIIPTIKSAGYRPSTGKFKEAMFSILTSGAFTECLIDKNILDLFAGTGSLGLEAISRGAKMTSFVDIDATTLNSIKSFAIKHNILDKTLFINTNASRLPPTKTKYDLVFIDPPYRKGLVEVSLLSMKQASWLNDNALLIIEVGSNENVTLPDWCEHLDTRIYGSSKMIIARSIMPFTV